MINQESPLKWIKGVAGMLGGNVGSLSDIRDVLKEKAREAVEDALSRFHLVTRAEFERVEAIALKARTQQEALEKRLSALEKKRKNTKKKS